MDLLGQSINHYELLTVLSHGENVVYQGFDTRLNRRVVVKVLSAARSTNSVFVQQFQQDMQRISGLEHPNILPIYDYGQHEDRLFIVSRYIESGTLNDRLPQYHLPARAQKIISHVAQALDYLHNRGTVHGNIKPANILLDSKEQPLLTDFGDSQGLDIAGRESAYLSPEQARGEPIDRRTDIYALGVLLYEMVIGQVPQVGSEPKPRSVRPDLPVAVEQVIVRAMAQNPDQRYQSAGELNDALSSALTPQAAPQAQPAAPASAPQPAVVVQNTAPAPHPAPRRGTNWLAIILGLAVLCLLATILGGLFGVFGQDSQASSGIRSIFIWDSTDSSDSGAPESPEEPAEPETPAPEAPAPEEPAPEEPAPEEPAEPEAPAEEPAPEEKPADGEGG